MADKTAVLEAERAFFAALVGNKLDVLNQVLGEDFLLIDALTGAAVPKSVLIAVLSSGQLKFDSIEPVEWLVRVYPPTAVVTGRSHMKGHHNGNPFTLHSRYTHVYVEHQGRLRLVTAQGTPVLTGE